MTSISLIKYTLDLSNENKTCIITNTILTFFLLYVFQANTALAIHHYASNNSNKVTVFVHGPSSMIIGFPHKLVPSASLDLDLLLTNMSGQWSLLYYKICFNLELVKESLDVSMLWTMVKQGQVIIILLTWR